MFKTLSFITSHPLTRDRPLSAIGRFVRWQVVSRLKQEVKFDWIEGSKLIVRNGMTGATGNIYCGLHEFSDMAFLLHFLRPGDLFVDVGANIGSYTVLASAVCGADTIAVEPDPVTMRSLKKNIAANGIGDAVTAIEAAVGREEGEVSFTVGLDTVNQVAGAGHTNTRKVRVVRLDDLLRGRSPAFIKLDVEGYEAEVIGGAREALKNPSLLAIETESRDEEVLSKLRDAGFVEYGYDPFSRQISECSGQASNALFLRAADVVARRLSGAQPRKLLHNII
ncbi:MAG: FkbM family methyltransferase [Porphyrobacter sp.]|nr:FkbM family methyltransferase [Porphyrobacter sp.]